MLLPLSVEPVQFQRVGDCPSVDCPLGDCPVVDCPLGDCPLVDCPRLFWR